MQVAVLGAGGTMGLGMARNLAAAGLDVRAWNRSQDKLEPLADCATLSSSPAEAAAGADVVITILSDGDAVLDVVEDIEFDGIWLQMSTIGLEAFERCASLADDRFVALIDAPVLGTKQPAEQGELVVLAGGPEDLRERVDPIFDAVGKKTIWVGEAGSGTRLKLAVNTWILAVVEGTAETLALAEGLGLDPSLVLEAVSGGPLDLPYLQMKGKAMINRRFEPSFRLALAAKDARLVAEAAREAGLDLPLVDTVRAQMESVASEHGDEDMAATFLASAPGAGATRR